MRHKGDVCNACNIVNPLTNRARNRISSCTQTEGVHILLQGGKRRCAAGGSPIWPRPGSQLHCWETREMRMRAQPAMRFRPIRSMECRIRFCVAMSIGSH